MAFDFTAYVHYNRWANERLLSTAEQVPHDLLMQDALLSMGNAFDTLRHTLDVQWSWLMGCQGQPATELLWNIVPLPDLQSVAAYWREEDARLIAFVASLSDADFERELQPAWSKAPRKIGHMLIHIVNHGTNHRTELGWHFTWLGFSPGDLDFMDYIANAT